MIVSAALAADGTTTFGAATVADGALTTLVSPRSTAAEADASGATQPLAPAWNLGGYATNVVHRVPVTVDD